MDKQTRKRMLEWFLRFINKDLNQLDLGEKMKLIGDAIYFCDLIPICPLEFWHPKANIMPDLFQCMAYFHCLDAVCGFRRYD